MDKEIQEKVIATAREFKDQGECDIWHTIWHEGIPYDMHLMLDQSLEDQKHEYEVFVYPVKQDGHAVLLTIPNIAISFCLNIPFQTEENGNA